MIAVCRLCDKPEKLIEAHIIPKWAFKYLKEENHLFQISNGIKSRKLQDGYKDSGILCRKCDGDILGKYDAYGKIFFDQDFQSQIKHIKSPSGDREEAYLHITDFDYAKLKLFLLSILWRASLSSLPPFSKVSLGARESELKDIFLKGSVPNENIFPIVLATWKPPAFGLGFEKTILAPRIKPIGGIDCYSFIMAGFEVNIPMGDKPSSVHVAGYNIGPKGFYVIVTSFESSTIGKLTKQIRAKFQEQRQALRTK